GSLEFLVAHGRNASSVTTRNSGAPSDTSSSGKRRGPAKRRTRLSTSVYQRKPRVSASTSTYHGRAIATRRRTLHHGTHSVRGRSPVSQTNMTTTTSGPSAPRRSFV